MTGLVDFITQPELAKDIQRAVVRDSIPGQVGDQKIMTLPEMTISAYVRDKTNDKISINKRSIITKNYITKTEYTLEALEDLYRIYGENLKEVLLHHIKFEQSQDLDSDFITFCKANSIITNTISFTEESRPDYEQIHMNIYTKLSRERVKLAYNTQLPIKTFTIASPNLIAGILTRIPATPIEKDGISYVASMGNNDFYMDTAYDSKGKNDYMIVGAKGDGIIGSSIAYGTYDTLLYFAQDPDSGEQKLFFSNRVGFEMNALDTSINGTNTSNFLRYFEVDLKDFEDI